VTEHSVAHETFVIEKTYDATVAQTFRAWAEPALKARWFAGSLDALGVSYELDFRVGGREKNRGGPPGGPLYTFEAEFRDIVPEHRIVYTNVMHADDRLISVSVTTVEFRDQGARTVLLLTELGTFLDGLDNVAQRENGTTSLLASLGELLKDVGT
jgi:uncharacterized protein YndB with AHSA1/START domain